jgi:hypothetical protein
MDNNKINQTTDHPVIGWRDHVAIHPAANILPAISDTELAALTENIKTQGQQLEIALYQDSDGNLSLLDGRSRLDAMEKINLPIIKDGALDPDVVKIITKTGNVDPYEYVLSAIVHRRHLNAEDKRRVIAELLKAKPEQSNRNIARQSKADDKTVAKVRAELESSAEIPQLEKTVGADGKSRTSHKLPPEIEQPSSATNDTEIEQYQTETAIGPEDFETKIGPEDFKIKTKAEIAAEKFEDDFSDLFDFSEAAEQVLSCIEQMMKMQQAARRVLKRRSKLSKDQIKQIEAIVGIKLDPAKKIFNQSSKIKIPTGLDGGGAS